MSAALLPGPSGIRIGGSTSWVFAYYRGVPIAGLSFANASIFPDGGRRTLYAMVGSYWGSAVVEEVVRGGIIKD